MKKKRDSYVSAYRMAWLMVFFDLPMTNSEERRNYQRFREELLKEGYLMIQYSVYARPCPSYDRVQTQLRRLEQILPPEGEVRVLYLTDAQWGKMKTYFCRKRKAPEEFPRQLQLF